MEWSKNKTIIAIIVILLAVVIYLMYSAYSTPPSAGTTVLNGTVTVRVVYALLTGQIA